MSLERVQTISAASVPPPPAGYYRRFLDLDLIYKVKDSNGVVTPIAMQFSTNGITNAYLAQVATQTIKGRITAGTGDVEDLTPAQVTAMLNTFTTSLKGLVPASGGGTTNYLRADGTFANPLPIVSEAVATTTTTTTSGTDVLISGMTITPVAGTYIADFNCFTDNLTNGRIHYFSIYVNGVQIANTETQQFVDSAKPQCFYLKSGKITTTGVEAIEIRWRVSASTGNVYRRLLTLTKCQ